MSVPNHRISFSFDKVQIYAPGKIAANSYASVINENTKYSRTSMVPLPCLNKTRS